MSEEPQMTLKPVLEKLNKISEVSKRKEKEALISEFVGNPFFRKSVYYALHPFKQYNTTQVEFISDAKPTSVEKIFNFLEKLSEKKGATDDEIHRLSRLCSFDKESSEVIKRVVNKDLKCGASIKTFKKFIPELPEYEVMRCENDLEKFLKLCNNDFSNIYVSVKFDGARCITTGDGIYLSRSGKEFPNFSVFDDEIQILKNKLEELYPSFDWKNISLDGEVVIEDENGIGFQDLMTQIHRLKDVDPSKFKFYIFDLVMDKVKFIDRYQMLSTAFSTQDFDKIDLVSHFNGSEYFNSVNDIKDLAQQKIHEGYEGLVLKRGSGYYENKKSKEWCKVKEVHTVDVRVIDWEYGKGKYKTLLGGLICSFKDGTTFHVGSGFSDKEREKYLNEIPSIVEIEYQELTKEGKPRFPVFKRVREDKNEID